MIRQIESRIFSATEKILDAQFSNILVDAKQSMLASLRKLANESQ